MHTVRYAGERTGPELANALNRLMGGSAELVHMLLLSSVGYLIITRRDPPARPRREAPEQRGLFAVVAESGPAHAGSETG